MTQLRIALIGGGFMGKAHSLSYSIADIAADIGARLVKQVLVDVNDEIAERQSREFGWAEHSADWRAVIARDDIDIVDICTPPQFHAPIAIAAAEAGKHVFIEKPITNDAAEARSIVDAIEKAGVVGQVGFNYRHAPAVEFTKRLLDAGELGRPLLYRTSYLQSMPPTSEQTGPEPWRARKATGGSGTVGDIGSHIIDSAEYLFGDIVRVAARARTGSWATGWLPDEQRIADDLIDKAAVWIAEFANGTIGTFTVSGLSSGRANEVHWELDATKGAVEFDWNALQDLKISYVEDPVGHRGFRTVHTSTQHPDSWWAIPGFGFGYSDVSAIQFQKFVRRILGHERATPTAADALHVQQVVEAVYAAAESDTWVDVPARGRAAVAADEREAS